MNRIIQQIYRYTGLTRLSLLGSQRHGALRRAVRRAPRRECQRNGHLRNGLPELPARVGADKDPSKRKDVEAGVPLRRLCQPEEAAHFVASLIDGKNAFQTSQFFAIDGGWAFE